MSYSQNPYQQGPAQEGGYGQSQVSLLPACIGF